MKIAEADILIVPGWGGSGPQHWQSRWIERFSTARRVEQDDWDTPNLADWTGKLVDEVRSCTRPVVLVAHSLGVAAVVHALPQVRPLVRGAFLVAAPDVDDSARVPAPCRAFAPLPTAPLGIHAWQIASRDDPYCSFERADQLSRLWETTLLDAGAAGHINTASGHGPWPEGMMSFAHFMAALK
ncbi:RBBP9/YdeN family alpha/beta hydrolase [Polymorphum gilvum]|uniref:Alpha/Beta hydrolase family n=1 Tax=Polymorphum gilvum (strain LMG 25793 / CGMCC 1.9160 / SL003B-26A1) TaxID=991905 RepID=F2J4X2_POLGS|nr:alpha/beta hydrolase [Polymorphum gilvum]ADZ70014.1 Alpha/Beta hydrolase family [Polymorphum gilvum SL003B-26A1]